MQRCIAAYSTVSTLNRFDCEQWRQTRIRHVEWMSSSERGSQFFVVRRNVIIIHYKCGTHTHTLKPTRSHYGKRVSFCDRNRLSAQCAEKGIALTNDTLSQTPTPGDETKNTMRGCIINCKAFNMVPHIYVDITSGMTVH